MDTCPVTCEECGDDGLCVSCREGYRLTGGTTCDCTPVAPPGTGTSIGSSLISSFCVFCFGLSNFIHAMLQPRFPVKPVRQLTVIIFACQATGANGATVFP